uniref:Uncharacterized protein n=1 Tax=Klebsiella pneumoniae TaxID=573 RepID=A0A8B0SVU4_KLEPN|nr:hypothetical protein [Klebsiella pneumoniae]
MKNTPPKKTANVFLKYHSPFSLLNLKMTPCRSVFNMQSYS